MNTVCLIVIALVAVLFLILFIVNVRINVRIYDETEKPFVCGFGNFNRTENAEQIKSPSCSKEHQGKKK